MGQAVSATKCSSNTLALLSKQRYGAAFVLSELDSMETQTPLLTLIRKLSTIAQNGLEYSLSDYDTERYTAVRQIAAEMLSLSTHNSTEAWRLMFEADRGYATPKIDVRAAVISENRILLVRE